MVDQTSDITINLAERIAVLENEWANAKTDLSAIKDKLDSLLELKSRGMGALWLIGLVISSGVIGLVSIVFGFVNRPHL